MLQHGIEGIRTHLATLPLMREQTVEEARKMYDKADRVRLCPAGGGRGGEGRDRRRAGRDRLSRRAWCGDLPLLPRGRLRHRLPGLPPAPRGGARRRVAHPGLRPRLPARAGSIRFRPRWTTRWPGTAGCSMPVSLPVRFVIGGDSAGGGLTVAALVAIREAGLALPAGGGVHLSVGGPHQRGGVVPDPRGPGPAGVPGGHRPLGQRLPRRGRPPAPRSPRRCTPTSRAFRRFSSRSVRRRCSSTIPGGSPRGAKRPGSRRPSRSGRR